MHRRLHRLSSLQRGSSSVAASSCGSIGSLADDLCPRWNSIAHTRSYSAEEKKGGNAEEKQRGNAGKEDGHTISDPRKFAALKQFAEMTTPIVVETTDNSVRPIRTLINKLMSRLSSYFVQVEVETDHDNAAFLRGTEEAFYSVHECLSEDDWDSLKGMLSTRLWKRLRAEREDFDHFGLKVVLHPPSNVRAFDPVFSFVHRNKILRFDELEDEEEAQIDDAQVSEVAPGTAATAIDPTATPSTSGGGFFRQRGFVDITGFYQVASVQFSSTKKEEVMKKGGQLAFSATENNKRESWIFFRGPLPSNLPRRELQLKWKVMMVDQWWKDDGAFD